MLIQFKKDYSSSKTPPYRSSLMLGASIGFLSGLVGIGGGIFLSPILYIFKWGKPKQISALCCLFIFFNSISGLVGQLSKTQISYLIESSELFSLICPLALAVLIGGQIGSFIGIFKLSSSIIEKISAVLIIFVALRVILL